MIRHLVNILLWFLPPTRLLELRRQLLRLAGVELEAGVSICGRSWIYGRGVLRVGRDTWFSPDVVIYTHAEVPIVIGANCDIGPGVVFVTGSHEMGPASRRAGRGTARPIKVGDGCWIGAGSTILGGIEIGPGAIIAAGAMVTQSIPANVLAAGVPAAVKKPLD